MKKLSHKHILFETVGHQLPSSLHFHYKLFKITSSYLPILQAPPACFYHLITLIIISDHPYRNSDNNNSAKHDYTKMPNQSNVRMSHQIWPGVLSEIVSTSTSSSAVWSRAPERDWGSTWNWGRGTREPASSTTAKTTDPAGSFTSFPSTTWVDDSLETCEWQWFNQCSHQKICINKALHILLCAETYMTGVCKVGWELLQYKWESNHLSL